MFLFVLGLNFKAVKLMFLEPVLCDERRQVIPSYMLNHLLVHGAGEYTFDLGESGCFRARGSLGAKWKPSWPNSSPGQLPTWDNRTWLARLARDKAMLTEA